MMSKWISADSIINKFNSHVGFTTCADVKRAIKLIREEPTIDLVRCKECKHCFVDGEQVKFNACELNHNKVQSDNWFCADGEREGE